VYLPWARSSGLGLCREREVARVHLSLLREALPAGVVNVISGSGGLGSWLSNDRALDKISFTGSTTTGRDVMAGAAPP
jgi:acyl-CoA reductase-like NAD-dependent aldehyde dehydrogenase